MTIALGSDHASFELKECIKAELGKMGYTVNDLGSDSKKSVDYPDYAVKVAREVKAAKADYGILFCGSGIGMSIAANKVQGIRAALCNDLYLAEMARRHNNANILVMGGRVIGKGLALEILKKFLNTAFEGGRHQDRLDKVTKIEQEQ
ncbi:MAG: ribose 5-phosphate isomerase B [Candidatus Firestonebacteria bacterium]